MDSETLLPQSIIKRGRKNQETKQSISASNCLIRYKGIRPTVWIVLMQAKVVRPPAPCTRYALNQMLLCFTPIKMLKKKNHCFN